VLRSLWISFCLSLAVCVALVVIDAAMGDKGYGGAMGVGVSLYALPLLTLLLWPAVTWIAARRRSVRIPQFPPDI
jgi:hypothetical protein